MRDARKDRTVVHFVFLLIDGNHMDPVLFAENSFTDALRYNPHLAEVLLQYLNLDGGLWTVDGDRRRDRPTYSTML